MENNIQDFRTREMKLMWVYGALERLVTLGLIYQAPYKIAQEAIDVYLILDDMRDKLFPEDSELKEILRFIMSSTTKNVDNNVLDEMYVLLVQYKNNREDIVKYALEHSIN
jgi:hypothetical protein